MVFTPPFSSGMAASRLAGIVKPDASRPPQPPVHLYARSGLVMINNGPAVLDSGDNRLLIFDPYSSPDWTVISGDTTVSKSPPPAIAVLGQGSSLTNFTTSTANNGNQQAAPSSSSTSRLSIRRSRPPYASGDLFVVDAGNNRVLVYPNAGQTASANGVLGQSGFPYNSPNSIQGKEFFFGPSSSGTYDAGIAVDSSSGTPHLYISDPSNHRVLGFEDARTIGPGLQTGSCASTPIPAYCADIVIGEPDMFTSVCNYNGVPNPPTETNAPPRQPTQSSLCYPTGLAVDPPAAISTWPTRIMDACCDSRRPLCPELPTRRPIWCWAKADSRESRTRKPDSP